jgi:hypothetical protein
MAQGPAGRDLDDALLRQVFRVDLDRPRRPRACLLLPQQHRGGQAE